ncbi:retinol dehydrogenase 13 [Chaetomium strumarium]|uniref:Retinol dehydrogenase 13 n=1 Tax=Chaetomium strumarium TaxID=1170767 RepID=A0AAJ0H1F5_9PEZI|nr:retinol dehydrogenase 13 [Chaetomium strumarium]
MSPFNFHTTGEEVVSAWPEHIKGRTFLITGPSNKSLAAGAAIDLAKKAPEHIILVGRNKAKIDPVVEQIRSVGAGVQVTFVQCDLSDHDSVRKAADEINANGAIQKIDVVINCAGVMNIHDYTLDKQGIEMTFSACHVGHFLLTNLILPKVLAAGKGARIINVTSVGHTIGPVRFDDPNFSAGAAYDPWSAYGQAKTANILYSVELSRRLADRGVVSNAPHPGGIAETGLVRDTEMHEFDAIGPIAVRNTGREFRLDHPFKTIDGGVSSILAAALDPGFADKPGIYIRDCQPQTPYEYAADPEAAKRLWALSEQLVGQKFDF